MTIDWDMTLADIVKKMKADGYDLSSMTNTERADAFFATITQAQADVTTAEDAEAAAALIAQKRSIYMAKHEELFQRTIMRAVELAEANGTWNLVQLPTLSAQAFSEVKAAMIAEM